MNNQAKTPGAMVLDRCQCGSSDCKVVGAPGVWWAECRACGSVSGPHKTGEQALDHWNSTRSAFVEQPPAVGGEQMACMPVERCYDVRAKMIIAFNEAKKTGGDLDDCLEAAYRSALRFSPNPRNSQAQPTTAEAPAPMTELSEQFVSDHLGKLPS